jgi:hypothetical protein
MRIPALFRSDRRSSSSGRIPDFLGCRRSPVLSSSLLQPLAESPVRIKQALHSPVHQFIRRRHVASPRTIRSDSTEETLEMIRRARVGEMWGYEPTETE